MPHEFQHLDRPPPRDADPLARALADLEPAPPAINRDRLLYAAGAASRVPVVRLWQLTAGVLAAVGFAAGLNWRSPVVVVQAAVVDRPAPAEHAPPPVDAPAASPPGSARVAGRPAETARSLRARSYALAVVLQVLPDWNRHADRPADRPE